MSDTAMLLHVCQAGAAATLVRSLVHEPVIGIPDDGGDAPAGNEAALVLARHAFEELSRHRGTLVIWVGSHQTEQAMRRRLHALLRDMPVTIAEIRVSDGDRVPFSAGVSVAMHDVAHLRQALKRPVLVSDTERARLAGEWDEAQTSTLVRRSDRRDPAQDPRRVNTPQCGTDLLIAPDSPSAWRDDVTRSAEDRYRVVDHGHWRPERAARPGPARLGEAGRKGRDGAVAGQPSV